MISIDAVLLGLVVVAFMIAVPIGLATTGLLLWASARRGKGRRRALTS